MAYLNVPVRRMVKWIAARYLLLQVNARAFFETQIIEPSSSVNWNDFKSALHLSSMLMSG